MEELSSSKSKLLSLPGELLEELCSHFDVRSLTRLSQCSRTAREAVLAFGFPSYAKSTLFFHSITNPARLPTSASWADKVRIATTIDNSWQDFRNISVEVFAAFPSRTMPVFKLQLDQQRMIVAGGSSLTTYTFAGNRALPVEESHLRSVRYRDQQGRLVNSWIGRTATDDITSIACVDGTGDIILAHASGLLQRCRVEGSDGKPYVKSISRYSHPRRLIQAMDASSSGLLACATPHQGGTISLYKTASPWLEPFTWKMKTKPWSLQLQPSNTPRWLALGHSGPNPLSIYTLGEDGEAVNPQEPVSLLGNNRSTAVYGFSTPPPSSPIGAVGQTIVTAWYDGAVRIHDLRRASKRPVVTMEDPLADGALYSVACGGGSGCTVVAGTARHGLVRVWDVRHAKKDRKAGKSLFGPGGDNSPVYGLEMEHDRLFGLTDRRAWMLEFGTEVQHSGQQGMKQPSRQYDTPGSRFSKNRRYAGQQLDRDNNALYYYKHSEMKLTKAG